MLHVLHLHEKVVLLELELPKCAWRTRLALNRCDL